MIDRQTDDIIKTKTIKIPLITPLRKKIVGRAMKWFSQKSIHCISIKT